jgi:hypothetical protein
VWCRDLDRLYDLGYSLISIPVNVKTLRGLFSRDKELDRRDRGTGVITVLMMCE